jgi:tricorn protease
VVPISGGAPRRLTHHPAFEFLVGWTPDGRSILFTSRRSSFTHPLDKLFTVPREGGAAVQLPMAQGGPGSLSPDGRQIAFNRNSSESWNPFRGYRGGRRATISVYDFAARRETAVAASDGNDVFPMWWRDSIYFASDRDGRMNLYEYEVGSRRVRQLTHHRDADVRHPSLAPGGRPRIIYELGGELHVFSIAGGRDETLSVTVGEELPEKAPRQAAVAPYVTSFAVAPGGEHALVSGRGELFEITAATGAADNLTRTSGVREHGAVYSPDGRQIAYSSDASGEYEIYLRSPDEAAGRRLTREGPGFRQGLRWSPDGRKLLFADQTQSLSLLDVATGAVVRIDTSRTAPIEGYDWTPDSASVVYAKMEDNLLNRLYRYDGSSGKSTPLGDGMTDDASPAVDASGKRVYFLSARTFQTSFSDFEQTFGFNDTIAVYAMPPDGSATVERLPIGSGSLSQLAFAGGRLFYLARDRRTGAQSLRSFDPAQAHEETVAEDAADYRAERGAVLVRSGDRLSWLPRAGDGFDLNRLAMELDPVQEWRQIFHDAWRLERDYFHEPSMNGVDWPALRTRYERLLPSVGSREDLNYLLGLLVAELGTSHTWAFGGDMPQYPGSPPGVLGCDFAVEQGRYRIERIVRGDGSAPETRSPLATAEVHPGDFVLAVDGREVTATDDIYSLLVAGKEMALTIGPAPDGRGARTVKVTPAASDMEARYVDWVNGNRARIARATAGRCGYVHVPNTGRAGIARFARDFFAQIDREALIVDIRWNSGGLFPASMIEHLRRIPLAAYGQRHGNDTRVPGAAVHGPKVLLTNNNTISGGDAFAIYFRAAGLGPIVGSRTAGATIGNVGMPLLVDNGEVGVPALAFKPPAGGPQVENAGVTPDVEVAPEIDEHAQEPDPQLAKAIAVILGQLER